MANSMRYILGVAVGSFLIAGTDIFHGRSAAAAPPPSAQNVNIVSPLTASGSVGVEGTIKGIVNTRTNPALTHVGALASNVVTIKQQLSTITEIHNDGSETAFTSVPTGRALVVTDVEWVQMGTGGPYTYVLQVHSTPSYAIVFEDADAGDFISRRTNLTTGITFGPGTGINAFIAPNGDSTQAGPYVNSLYLHGYYVDAP